MFDVRQVDQRWRTSFDDGSVRRSGRRWALLLLLLSVVLTAYTRDHDYLGVRGTQLVGEVLSPLYAWANRGWAPVRDVLGNYVVLADVKKENRNLHQRIAALQTRVLSLEEYQRENERLKGLLKALPKSQSVSVVAQVIAHDLVARVSGVTIDRGLAAGIKERSAVVNGSGVVGVVSAVMNDSAKVLLLTDPRSGVDVRTSESRARGVVRGGGATNLQVDYVTATQAVQVGEKVLTSGLDGIFPAGLLVGVVSKVSKGGEGLFRNVVLKPAVDFQRLEEVLVLISPGDGYRDSQQE